MPKTQRTETTPQEVYDYCYWYMDNNGKPPTVREIAKHFKRSLCCIQHHMETLKNSGYITWEEHIPRSLTLVGYRFKLVKVS